MAHHDHNQNAVVRGRGTLWLVWLIPLVALLMAGWLVYKHYAQKGTRIVVVFDSGKGLEVGKTPLLYQGIKIGTVTDVSVDKNDIYKIRAIITVDSRSAPYVTRKGTTFIKVEPRISVTGITGLDTILKGVYIDLYPAARTEKEILKKPLQFEFQGLDHYPPKRYEKGLYLTLVSPKAAVRINAPVLYKDFTVGQIIDKRLVQGKIHYTAYIKQQYAHLVNAGSKFWKMEAVELQANLAGVRVKMDSLATLLTGGVAFDSPDGNVSAKPKPLYTLYDSELDTRLDPDIVTLVADKAYNIDPTFSMVMYKGFKVGKILSLHYDTAKSQTVFKIRFDRRFRHLANTKAWFWIVKPIIGIRKIKGLDAILSGPYIALDTQDIHAPAKKRFILHEEPIPLKGKKIHLTALHAKSIQSGTAIFFKNIPIGEITKVRLLRGSDKLDIEATIFEKYRDFLNDSSLFYVRSGVEMEMSLKEIHIETGSLESIVIGGVTMVTPDPKAGDKKRRFFIYKDYKTFKKARYLRSGGAFYHIVMKDLGSLQKGSPILYKKVKAGEVVSYRYRPKHDDIDLSVFIQKDFLSRINASTRFENVSGMELKVNLPDVEVKMDSLQTVLSGGLRFYTPKPHAQKVHPGHYFKLFDEMVSLKADSITVRLWMDQTHDLHIGSHVLYKDFPIGKIMALQLHDDRIEADLAIQKRYAYLLHKDSIFWLKAFQTDLEGIKNIGNALSGPAIVLTPGRSKAKAYRFELAENPPPPTYGKPGLRVVLLGDRRSSLDAGSPIYYRQVPIGVVESWALSEDATAVRIIAYIEPRYAHLVRNNAKFYIAGAFGMDVNLMGVKVHTETLKTLVSGGIGMAVPDKAGPVVPNGYTFKLYNEPKAEWMQWHPKL